MSVSIAPSPFGSLSVSVAETGSTLEVSVLSTSNCVLTMDLGVPGPQGPQGDPGQGVPAGGSAGQVLAKVDGVDYNTEWINVSGNYLPLAGGVMDVNALVTFSNGAQNSEIGGWGFGVQDTATPSHYATVEPQAFTVTDGSSFIVVTPTGITFPDSTTQTTAFSGGSFRTLTDYDFTNVSDTKLTTFGLTLTPPVGTPEAYDSFIRADLALFYSDSSMGGMQPGIQYRGNYSNSAMSLRTQTWTEGEASIDPDGGYSVTVTPNGITFGTYAGTASGTVNYGRNGITFGNGSYQYIAFPGFANAALTGNPTAPTPTAGDNDTSIATTAFVTTAVANGLAGGTAIAKNIETEVRNQSGSTMAAGTIVYISGATGNKPLITKAQANNDANSAQTIGFVKTSIANNGTGYVITRGSLENIDTSALTEGVQLYLSPSTAGGWTTTKPYAPDHLVYVGIVIRSHPTLGIIYVSVQNGYEVAELHDVSAQTPSNLDLLSYNSSTSLWQNSSFSTLGLLTTSSASSTYLAKSDNLASLTSASTARTNLGLGTAATLASSAVAQTANNLSDLASASTARTNLGLTSLATASFATLLEAQTGSSSTAVMSPVRTLDVLTDCTWTAMPIVSTTTATSGTGAVYVNASPDYGYITGPNANLAGYCQKGYIVFARSNSTYGFNLTKESRIACKMAIGWSTSFTGITYTLYIRQGNSGNGALAGVGYGIEINMATKVLSIKAHNGTTLTTKTTSWAVPFLGIASVDFMVRHDGSGTVYAYADGVLIDSTSGMASTTSTAFTQMHVSVEINSAGGTSTAGATGYVSNLRSFFAHG